MQKNKQLNRNCEICGSDEAELLSSQEFLLEKDNPLPDNYDVVSCTQCGFIFADVESSQQLYDQYYSNFSKYENINISSGAGSTISDKKRLLDTAEYINAFIDTKEQTILDIGAALGGQLNVFSTMGYKNLYALEPSASCVKHMLNNNIKAIEGTIFDDLQNTFQNKKFDIIIISHVFEHIFDLNRAIKNLYNIMHQKTKIYIEVPNASAYHKYSFTPFYYFDIEHINHFSIQSLQSLFSNHAFKIIDYKENYIALEHDLKYPVVYTILSKENIAKESILKFINHSLENNIDDRLEILIKSKNDIVVWGAGNYTKRLLAQTKLLECNIKFFVDKDHKKIGTSIKELVIKDISALNDFKGTIIIASALYSKDIIMELKKRGNKNNIVIL